jgi:hypothetical protein
MPLLLLQKWFTRERKNWAKYLHSVEEEAMTYEEKNIAQWIGAKKRSPVVAPKNET